MLSVEVRNKIGESVATALSPTEMLSVLCQEGQDHEGNNVVFVTLKLPSNAGPLPATVYMRAMIAASQALLRSNDERIPLVSIVREGEPDPIEERMDQAL